MNRRFSYRTVRVPPVSQWDARPDVATVVAGLSEGERIVSVYPTGVSVSDVHLEALVEREEAPRYREYFGTSGSIDLNHPYRGGRY